MTAVMSHPQSTQTISFPVLIFTDSLPRDDLHGLRTSRCPDPATGPWDFRQHSPGDGWFRRPPSGLDATFDFRITAPPDEVVPSVARSPTRQDMIGIALGSPGLARQNESPPTPQLDRSIFPSQDGQELADKEVAHKPSKWKKIGGLFKAKNDLPPQERLRMGEPKPKQEYRQIEKPPRTNERTNSIAECQSICSQLSQGQINQSHHRAQRSLSLHEVSKDQLQPRFQGSLLDVNIPNVQMERYSVMFGSIVNDDQRPSLLARRAKTLKSLQVEEGSTGAPVPAPIPRRRATSPAPSSFTEFPTLQHSDGAGLPRTQNFSRGPNSIIRANTLPIEGLSQQQPRPSSNINGNSSVQAPVIPKTSSETSSTSSFSNSHEKPLPALRPESHLSHLKNRPQPPQNIHSPHQIRLQQSAKSQKAPSANHDVHTWEPGQPRRSSLSRVTEKKQFQVISRQKASSSKTIENWLAQQKPEQAMRQSLRVDRDDRPVPPAKDI